MSINIEDKERYKRQIMLKEFGEEGQEKLASSSCLIVGAGGLASPVLYYLGAAGVGRLGIIDADKVELSNLNRQIIHNNKDLGRLKVESAKEKINALNPNIDVKIYREFLKDENADEILKDYDLIIDATDSFRTKFLINDVCVRNKKPFIYAGLLNFKGQLMLVIPGKTPCLHCIFGDELPKDVDAEENKAVLGALAGIIGSMQALEAIKYLTGIGKGLDSKLLIVDAFTMNIRKLDMGEKNKECKICSKI